MKDFKKLIKESHLGNPLNEVDDSKTVSTKHLDAIIYEDGGVKLRINSSNKSPYGYTKRDLIKSPFGVPDEEFTFDYIKKEIDEVYIKFPDEEIKELLNKVDQYKNSLNEEDRATRVDKMLSGEYDDEDYKDSKRYDDVRAELDEEFSSTEEKMINQIKSYKKRGSAMVNLPSKVRDFYFKNKEKIDALNEEFKVGDKVTYLGHPAVVTATKEYNGRDFVSVSYDKGTGKTKASDILATDGTVKAVKEDMNDPVLIKTRAAQMKRDAMDKKDLENKSKRISAEKAIDLRYELSILDKEREDILMRIEDIGVEMEQTAEPEGGPIADKLGERLMAAQRELRAVNNKIIDIKDDLGFFDMNESDLDEGNGGAKQDDEINLNVSNANDIADEEEAHSGVLELRNKLKETLVNRLK